MAKKKSRKNKGGVKAVSHSQVGYVHPQTQACTRSKHAFSSKILGTRYHTLITGLALFFIILFAVFLRLEDFIDWQKNPQLFKYQGEYQMTNFDSYYYLQIAKDLKNGIYDSLDEKRYVPNGAVRTEIPSLLPMLATFINKVFSVPLASVAIFIPVFLSPLLALTTFLLARQLSFNQSAALTAALFSIISITYVMRSRVGVFDTDSLNVVFTLLNSYLFLRFALYKNSRYLFLALGVINTLLYYLWWDNAASIVFLSAFVPFSIALLFFYESKKPLIKYFFLVILGLLGLYFFGEQLFLYIQLVFNQQSVFPIGDMVAELQAVNLRHFTKATTNSGVILAVALIGAAYLLKKGKILVLFIALPTALALLPFVAGSRFMIFSAPIIALGVGYFVQLLFYFKNKITVIGVYGIAVLTVSLGIYSTYHVTTDKLAKPAVLENRILLDALKAQTPPGADIWTNWDLGYQIHYYLDRGSFADGSVDNTLFYYLHFPLAVDNLALSANFMRFYHQQGKQGMHKLYKMLGSKKRTFEFLREILALNPEQAKKKLTAQELPEDTNLTTIEEWLAFLYPLQKRAIYLLLHQKMLKTMSWFKQGNIDLKTGKNRDLPLFLPFYNLREKPGEISNNDIKISTVNGESEYMGKQYAFAYILTFDGVQSEITNYPKQSRALFTDYNSGSKDGRFVFEWDKELGYGAVMSQGVANTTFNKLFMRQDKSEYFKPVALKKPKYQLWQVFGDTYEE